MTKMPNALTDSELRRQLLDNGFDPGPITDSTRRLYVNKLEKLLLSSPETSVKTLTELKNRRRSTPVHVAKPKPASLVGFSSEDSETEVASDLKKQKRRRRTLPPVKLGSKLPVSPLSISHRSFASSFDDSTNRTNGDDAIYCGGNLTRAKLTTGRRSLSSDHFETEISDIDSKIENKSFGNSSYGLLQSLRKFPQQTVQKLAKDAVFHNSFQNGHHTNSNFENEFKTEEDPKSTTNYSQWVSWFLVGIVAIFFVTVGLLYVGVKQKDNASINLPLKSFSKHICKGFTYVNCIESQDDLKVAVQAAYFVYNYLSEEAGVFECKEGKLRERWVPVETIKAALQTRLEIEDEKILEEAFSNCIILIKSHDEWGIKILQVEGSDEVRALESTISSKPLWCRITQAFKRVFKQIIVAILAIVSILGIGILIKNLKKANVEKEARVYSTVEKIIAVLQKHYDTCKTQPDLDQCLAIIHVRDMLIPLSERSDKTQLKIWAKAVQLITESESRIRVETQRLAGEDFLVWRWLQPSASEESRKGKIWQGQAFGSTEKGSNVMPFCPTPCLKIRNMFDPEVEYGDDWAVNIRDAILEKCEGNLGIVHIHIDVTSKEGCVYVKCNSSEAAGQGYRALHGWWFDGKLVTVKYLRLERYHERFSDSIHCTVSLKPSNNMRLSIRDCAQTSHSLENS